MKKIKNERGITLIALIITIVVLLILAAVAINSIQNEGILEYAQNAVSEYEKAQANEAEGLQKYENFLQNATIKNDTETEKPDEPVATLITFTIDSVEYQAEEGITWKRWIEEVKPEGFVIFGSYEFVDFESLSLVGVEDKNGNGPAVISVDNAGMQVPFPENEINDNDVYYLVLKETYEMLGPAEE